MKFSCDLKILNEVVSNVSLAISSKSTIPALEGVLLQCNDGQLTITGYNLEIGITKTIQVNQQEEGSIVLNARLFSDILKKMPNQEIFIESDERFMTLIQGADTEFRILGMSREEYPDLPAVEDCTSFDLPEYLLKNMINQTLFAISVNEQTPILTGSLFDISNGTMHVVSVDGYRVALRREKVNIEKDISFIVPGKTLAELTKLLSDQQDQIAKIDVCEKHILFEVDGYTMISRLLLGEYLDYKSAIPDGFSTRIHVEDAVLAQSIERTSIIINDRNKSPIKLETEGDSLILSCESAIGKVNDRCEAQVEGNQIRIAFNNKYMIDALRHTECDEIYIDMNGPLSPIKIIPVEGDQFLFLVLPVRLKNEN